MDRTKSRLAPALIVAGMLCLLLGVYAAGYFLCQTDHVWGDFARQRYYSTIWHCRVFSLAAAVEARTTGFTVRLGVSNGWDRFVLRDTPPPAEAALITTASRD
jgi:hypothetical protein